MALSCSKKSLASLWRHSSGGRHDTKSLDTGAAKVLEQFGYSPGKLYLPQHTRRKFGQLLPQHSFASPPSPLLLLIFLPPSQLHHKNAVSQVEKSLEKLVAPWERKSIFKLFDLRMPTGAHRARRPKIALEDFFQMLNRKSAVLYESSRSARSDSFSFPSQVGNEFATAINSELPRRAETRRSEEKTLVTEIMEQRINFNLTPNYSSHRRGRSK